MSADILIKFKLKSKSCDHIDIAIIIIIDNIRNFLINRFFRSKTIENAKCDSLPLINLLMTILSLLASLR